MSAPASESWARSVEYALMVESRLMRYERMTSAPPIITEYSRMSQRSTSNESSQKKTKAERATHTATAKATARSFDGQGEEEEGDDVEAVHQVARDGHVEDEHAGDAGGPDGFRRRPGACASR